MKHLLIKFEIYQGKIKFILYVWFVWKLEADLDFLAKVFYRIVIVNCFYVKE